MNKTIKSLALIGGITATGLIAGNTIEYLIIRNQITRIEKSYGKESAYKYSNSLEKSVQGIENLIFYGVKKSARDYIKDNS